MLACSQRKRVSVTDMQPEENHSDQSLTFHDPLWPMQWEPVGLIVCVFVCVHNAYMIVSSPLPALVHMLKDVPLTGISQAGFHV